MFGGITVRLAAVLLTMAVAQVKLDRDSFCCAGAGVSSVRICLETSADDMAIRSANREGQDKVAPQGSTFALTGAQNESRGRN